ncbi:MAG: MBL fold metallo-hydrolase [Archangium sp.]|nr:MBL fold metallo-hydrolase [Archangium sp.]
MKKMVTLHEKGSRSWKVIARDPARPNHLIDTNEYLISDGATSLLTDPGGQEIFPAVFSALSEGVDPRQVQWLFSSHQDPDVISSLALWLDFNPAIRCYTSWMWCTFIPHFGGDERTLIPLADPGGPITVGTLELRAVPAHFLHSPGNHHLFDPDSRILFTGDVGAALVPPGAPLFVEDFDAHIALARGFHQRWMGSADAKTAWCKLARELEPRMLCPQHGAIYRGDDVKRFIDWFDALEVGKVRAA